MILEERVVTRASRPRPASPRSASDAPIAFVISTNLQRRHLDTSQRSQIAAKLANLGEGGDQKSAQAKITRSNDLVVSQADAAKLMNVSVGSVKRAAMVARLYGISFM